MKSSLDRMEHGVLAFHALANLDQGDFTEGHELDRKWQVPKEMIGRRWRHCPHQANWGHRLLPQANILSSCFRTSVRRLSNHSTVISACWPLCSRVSGKRVLLPPITSP